MLERFIEQTHFTSQEDFIKNLRIKVPENFNFGYDVVDAWAAEEPERKALLWTNDKGEHIQFTFADLKKYTDMTASWFQSLRIGRGDKVMLILKRRYEFWFSIIALHKLGAVVIPATHLLTKKDIVYRCNAATIKMIVAAGEEVITRHIIDAMPESPSVEKLVSVGPEHPEGFEDFHQGMDLLSKTGITVIYFLCRDKRIVVANILIVFSYPNLDILQLPVQPSCLFRFPLRAVPLCIP